MLLIITSNSDKLFSGDSYYSERNFLLSGMYTTFITFLHYSVKLSKVTHPSTNRAWCWLTLLMRPTTLPT